ncbi:uncharacterized protein LOC124285779 [Haliotis rubra]|uniref:uncharacterized protein LOC124285779 n=1 Tax=Haliotis rubra TaxID=36100 RepID=UPI001EE5B7D6|nr:uncharacterized protein LOC124285779 [Haliotis rubra]
MTKFTISAQSCPSTPPHIENAHVSGRGNVVGSVRKYTCRKGFMDTSYPKGTNKARCRENFRWSQPGLRCTGPWIRKETEATRRGRKYVELTEEELKHVFADRTLIFQVKTCHDANFNYDKYETLTNFTDKITIGGGGNTYWKIYRCNQIKENNIVSCKEFRSFWIKFHGNRVQMGKGNTVGEREVISCEHKFKVIHLRISTYIRNAGTWLFKIHGG